MGPITLCVVIHFKLLGFSDTGALFLDLIQFNILFYDFEKLTIERFEPYGNTHLLDNKIDDILEEELTWSTGFKYIRPEDYLPYIGFQTISDENNLSNLKPGDFGGYCLAWCLWYLETKLKNLNLDSKTLVTKLINKILKSDIKFSEYIRNYANKINEFIATFYELIFERTPLFSADTDLKNSFPGLTDETKTFLIKFNQLTEENRPQFLKKQKLNANSDQMKKIIAFLRKEIGKD